MNDLEYALRRDLHAELVPYDGERAQVMIDAATRVTPRRAWLPASPALAAAAAVVVVGAGGAALGGSLGRAPGTTPAGTTSPGVTSGPSSSHAPFGSAPAQITTVAPAALRPCLAHDTVASCVQVQRISGVDCPAASRIAGPIAALDGHQGRIYELIVRCPGSTYKIKILPSK